MKRAARSSAGALALTLWWTGAHAVAVRLSRLELCSLALGVPLPRLCAVRWRYTAAALGLTLSYLAQLSCMLLFVLDPRTQAPHA